ncbi:MAG: hypothetical protein HRU10_06985 [Opitutales bacterium]|nr:hypothetical protein [Opitutales bacterium]
MKKSLLYVELKSGFSDDGPAWIGNGEFSKSGRTIYFNNLAFQSLKGAGVGANYYNLEDGDEYWISGVKKTGSDRHWAGRGIVEIDRSVVDEFYALTELKDLPKSEYVVVDLAVGNVRERILEQQNS